MTTSLLSEIKKQIKNMKTKLEREMENFISIFQHSKKVIMRNNRNVLILIAKSSMILFLLIKLEINNLSLEISSLSSQIFVNEIL